MGTTSSSRSRIQNPRAALQEESSDNNGSVMARRNPEPKNDLRPLSSIANDPTDSQEGVGEPVNQDESQDTNNTDKEVENGEGNNQKATNGEEDDDEDIGEFLNEVAEHVCSKPGRLQRHSAPERGPNSSKGKQKEPSNGEKGTTTRRRGRPAKRSLDIGGMSTSASTSTTKNSLGKRKQSVEEVSLRRSSRAAAELATKQITEQSVKRPKAASEPSTPSAPRQKRAAPVPGTKNKNTPTKTSTKHEFEVEYILGTRKRAGITEYHVKWKDFHVKDNTWEPAANLTHCAQALKEFRAGWSKK